MKKFEVNPQKKVVKIKNIQFAAGMYCDTDNGEFEYQFNILPALFIKKNLYGYVIELCWTFFAIGLRIKRNLK